MLKTQAVHLRQRDVGSSDGTDMVVQYDSESTFPEANVERESNTGHHKNLEVHPISSQVATSLEMKEAAIEAEEREREVQRKDALQTLKTTIVSAAVVAVARANFAITKKLRWNTSA